LFIQRVNGVGHYTVARVRAATAAQVNVYVDGVLMNLNGDAAVNLSTIPVENVERVEVYRGYVPARFSGSPIGGVINIVTKKPSKPGWYISEGFRSYGGYRGSYEYTTPLGQGTLLLGYNREVWTGDFPMWVRQGGYTRERVLDAPGNNYRNSDVLVKWQDENWTVKFAWKKNWEYLPWALGRDLPETVIDAYATGERNRQLQVTQTELQIGRRDTVGGLDWGWKAYYLNSEKRARYPWLMSNPPGMPIFPGEQWSDYDSKKWGLNLNGAMKMGENHLVEMNFDYSRESMDANGSDWDWWDQNSYYAQAQGRKYLRNYNIKEYHLSLQDTVKLNSAGDFKLTLMLKADKVDMGAGLDARLKDDLRWMYSGGMGLRKDFGDAWTLKTTWGTYNRHPNFYEIFGDGANIKPNTDVNNAWGRGKASTWETGTQFDFSVNWKGQTLGAKANVILTWFRREAENELFLYVPPMQGAMATYLPILGSKAHGVELGTNLNWKRVNLNLAATRTTARYHNSALNNNLRKTFTPEWVVSARLDYTLPGDKLNLFAEYYYVGEQIVYPGTMLDAIGTINLGAKYSFGKGFKFSLGVNDVLNKGYEQRVRWSDGYKFNSPYALPGRIYYATLEYKF
ncbi:MAG: TonB-dependent receptor, partial [Acidaminococcales bacterium]|nr:TonB-dependent receptor [Acidaminococcales bacterium]